MNIKYNNIFKTILLAKFKFCHVFCFQKCFRISLLLDQKYSTLNRHYYTIVLILTRFGIYQLIATSIRLRFGQCLVQKVIVLQLKPYFQQLLNQAWVRFICIIRFRTRFFFFLFLPIYSGNHPWFNSGLDFGRKIYSGNLPWFNSGVDFSRKIYSGNLPPVQFRFSSYSRSLQDRL